MAGFSSALLTRKAFLGGSAKVGRTTNGAKTFALFKKAQKQASKVTQPAKKNTKQAQKKVIQTPFGNLLNWFESAKQAQMPLDYTICPAHLCVLGASCTLSPGIFPSGCLQLCLMTAYR